MAVVCSRRPSRKSKDAPSPSASCFEAKGTGFKDFYGKEIKLGDTVLCPDGYHKGPVVFSNGAFRFDFAPGCLEQNFSLLHCERHKPGQFEVIR